jgi:hypothetical protein
MIAEEDGLPMLGASLNPSSRHPRWANTFRPSLGKRGARCGGAGYDGRFQVDQYQGIRRMKGGWQR